MKTKMCEINDSWVWLITAEEKINKLEDKQQKLSKLNTERKKLNSKTISKLWVTIKQPVYVIKTFTLAQW